MFSAPCQSSLLVSQFTARTGLSCDWVSVLLSRPPDLRSHAWTALSPWSSYGLKWVSVLAFYVNTLSPCSSVIQHGPTDKTLFTTIDTPNTPHPCHSQSRWERLKGENQNSQRKEEGDLSISPVAFGQLDTSPTLQAAAFLIFVRCLRGKCRR